MNASRDSESTFWVRWMLLTAFGLAAGLAAGFGLGMPTTAIVGMMLVVTVIGAIAGAVFGAIQSFALPARIPRAGRWILATTVGMAIGLTVGTVGVELLGPEKGNPIHEAVFIAVVGAVCGACVGLAQYAVMRGRVRGGGWWAPASALASGAGFLLGGLAAVALAGSFRTVLGIAIVGAVGGLTTGALGGLVMRRLTAA